MSSLSDFARGGAVGSGTDSTRTSPTGSHRDGASSSFLPSFPTDGSAPEGSLERGEEPLRFYSWVHILKI
jgi:hypothetical protein